MPENLLSFAQVSEAISNNDAILFGNGMSMEVLEGRFSYRNIADAVRKSYLSSGKRYLSSIIDSRENAINIEDNIRYLDESSKLISRIISDNVISPDLSVSSEKRHRENEKFLYVAEKMREIYIASQKEVVSAIINLHDEYLKKNEKFEKMKQLLSKFNYIFTVNYDILTYVAFTNLLNEDSRSDFSDMFTESDYDRGRSYFVPPDRNIDKKQLYYLHGGIHIFTDSESGRTYKISKKKGENKLGIVQLIKKRIKVENLNPTCVFEGTSYYKMEKIESNEYLNECYSALKSIASPAIYIFGLELMDNDIHLVNAIKNNSHVRDIYFGIYSDDELDIEYTKAKVRRMFKGSQKRIMFYSSKDAF